MEFKEPVIESFYRVLNPDTVPRLNLPICNAVVNRTVPTCNDRKIRYTRAEVQQFLQSLLN